MIRMVEQEPTPVEVKRYIDNLDLEGIKFLALQLIMYPKSKQFIINCITEFNKFYNYPLGENAKKHLE